MRRTLNEVLGASGMLAEPLPQVVLGMVADYCAVLRWKLVAFPPGLSGPVDRLSDNSACQAAAKDEYAFIQGDTVLFDGVHAWRVWLERPQSRYYSGVGLGVIGRKTAGRRELHR